MNHFFRLMLGACLVVVVCGCAATTQQDHAPAQNALDQAPPDIEPLDRLPVAPEEEKFTEDIPSPGENPGHVIRQVDYRMDSAVFGGSAQWSDMVERLPGEPDLLHAAQESQSGWFDWIRDDSPGQDSGLLDSSLATQEYFLPMEVAGQYASPARTGPKWRYYLSDLLQDHRNYYSSENLVPTAVVFGIGAVMANSDIDGELREFYQQEIDSDLTHDIKEAVVDAGEAYYLLPAAGAAMLLGSFTPETRFGEISWNWGSRSSRALMVGTPMMLLGQLATGGSRPAEHGPRRRPFNDDNGVSGHSFCGAIPFISAAKMTDNMFAKSGFYACSTLVGISRIDSDKHYASQVLLGWWMAYSACSAVDRTERQINDSYFAIEPMPTIDGGPGVGFVLNR